MFCREHEWKFLAETMLPITANWHRYFDDNHEGLGTTYERFILHHYFHELKKQYAVTSVLEVPSFGMTGISGINSIWWAAKNIPVTILDHSVERIALFKKGETRYRLPKIKILDTRLGISRNCWACSTGPGPLSFPLKYMNYRSISGADKPSSSSTMTFSAM